MSSYLIFFFHLYNIHNTLERVLNNRQIHIWIMGAITHILYRRTSFMFFFCCCCEPYKIHWNFLFRRSTHYCNKLIISSKIKFFFSSRSFLTRKDYIIYDQQQLFLMDQSFFFLFPLCWFSWMRICVPFNAQQLYYTNMQEV